MPDYAKLVLQGLLDAGIPAVLTPAIEPDESPLVSAGEYMFVFEPNCVLIQLNARYQIPCDKNTVDTILAEFIPKAS